MSNWSNTLDDLNESLLHPEDGASDETHRQPSIHDFGLTWSLAFSSPVMMETKHGG